MARREYNIKMNLSLTGTSFTDETHINVGSGSFYLDHDFFFDDDISGEVLIIRTAAAGGGTLLVRDTDYTITNQDTYLTTETSKNVYSTVTVTNAAYQATTLYFSGKYVADAVDKEDAGRVTWQYSAIIGVGTIAPTGYTVYGITTAASSFATTIPAAAMNYQNIMIKLIKEDTGAGVCTITRSGSNTFSGATAFPLRKQYDFIYLFCTGTNWLVLDSLATLDSANIVAGGGAQIQNLAHGMGVAPREVVTSAVCVSADANYAAGEEIHDVPNNFDSVSVRIWVVTSDATNINVTTQNAIPQIINKTTGAAVAMTTNKWAFRLRYKI